MRCTKVNKNLCCYISLTYESQFIIHVSFFRPFQVTSQKVNQAGVFQRARVDRVLHLSILPTIQISSVLCIAPTPVVMGEAHDAAITSYILFSVLKQREKDGMISHHQDIELSAV